MRKVLAHCRTDVIALILLLISLLRLMSVFVSKKIMPAALSVVDSLRLRLDDFVLCYLCDIRFQPCADMDSLA